MAKKCMKCGKSTTPKMAKGGMPTNVLGPAKKPFAAGIPYFTGAGQTGPEYMKKGGAVKKKLAALAPPTNKITRADVIAGALKNKRKKK
jgi:hypothetical protein